MNTYKKNNLICTSKSKEQTVVFTPSGLRGAVKKGTTILDAARQLGVDLDSVCGGRGICTKCKVKPSFGNFSNQFLSFLGNAISMDIVPPILSALMAEYLPNALAAVNLCNIALLPSLSEHLKKVLANEDINFDNESVNLISNSARGSVRDALTLLDQAK